MHIIGLDLIAERTCMGNDLQKALHQPDGRILGKMAHSDCTGKYVLQSILGNKDQKLFASVVGTSGKYLMYGRV